MSDLERLIYIKDELNNILKIDVFRPKKPINKRPLQKLHNNLCSYLKSLNIVDEYESEPPITDVGYGFKFGNEVNCFRCNATTYKNLNENNISYCDSCKDKNRIELQKKMFKF